MMMIGTDVLESLAILQLVQLGKCSGCGHSVAHVDVDASADAWNGQAKCRRLGRKKDAGKQN